MKNENESIKNTKVNVYVVGMNAKSIIKIAAHK